MAFPTKDSLLVPFSTNFNDRIVASLSTFALTAAQATAYTALHTPYITAYNALVESVAAGTRSESLTATKDATKADLLAYGRELYALVQAATSVSNANKLLLGVKVRAVPTPIPAPSEAPDVDIVSVSGNVVKIRLHGAGDPPKRGKPAGVASATVFSYVGETAPTDPSAWTFEGSTTRTVVDVVFPASVTAGSKVWVTAFWANPRALSGPAANPVSTNVAGSLAVAA